MSEEDIDDLKEQVDANTKMMEAILSGLLDGNVKFKLNESFDTYDGEMTRSISGSFEFSKSKASRETETLTKGGVEAKICLSTGGKYNFKTGQCVHENIKALEKKR
jgi:hypothetical protein